jgi:excinuclease ABC subunit A
VHGGRCEACQGQGQLKNENNFSGCLCKFDVCHRKRFNNETLQVKFKDKSTRIFGYYGYDGIEFFSAFPNIQSKFSLIQDVGLGYIRIGQPGNTLSGGEAQRVKLSKELSKRMTEKHYMFWMNPLWASAADVHRLIDVLESVLNKEIPSLLSNII